MVREVSEFPYTPRRGKFKGRTFDTAEELAAAEAEYATAPPSDEASPERPEPPKRRRAGRVTKDAVVAAIFPVNVALWMLPAARADALTDDELSSLAEAIVGVAAVNKYVESMILGLATSSAYLQLVATVGQIAVTRLMRHNMLPFGSSNGHSEASVPDVPYVVGVGDVEAR
jgi:hypothetical protein